MAKKKTTKSKETTSTKQDEVKSTTVQQPTPKTLDVKDMSDLQEKVSDVEVVGDPGKWELLSKASSKSEGWMKSTKTLELENGLLVQVSTQQGDNIAEAVTFVPGMKVINVKKGKGTVRKIVPLR